jgi:long-chain acyl-CoA synthetase
MHLGAVARRVPDRPAVIMAGSGQVLTFRELDEASNRLAHLLRSRGVNRGGRLAIFVENQTHFLEVAWAAQRAGLAYTTVNSHLTADEAAYIVNDCGATVVISSAALAAAAGALTADVIPHVHTRLMLDGTMGEWESYERLVADQPTTEIPDGCEGDFVFYSSGTTGRPKGIERPLTFAPLGEGLPGAVPLLQRLGVADGDVYLCPAPLFHGAPLTGSMGAHRLGATTVIMERFDAARALELIGQYSVTHSQWVPTMFVRMLKLDAHKRERANLSSHRAAIHAAAPCPVDVKRQMIDWWGPIISEYYSATEGVGMTFIDSAEWLAHPGSVGRPVVGEAHILDELGVECATGETGTVWFRGGYEFDYHNDPEKTAAAHRAGGLATVGDIGYVDAAGYVYLTDRSVNLVISGGANIYPQEAENVLTMHPKVLDVAVLGVPNADLGEEVKAVVQPIEWDDAGPELAAELLAFVREHLASYKCPRSVDFSRSLPRLDNGKLYKTALREQYRAASASCRSALPTSDGPSSTPRREPPDA